MQQVSPMQASRSKRNNTFTKSMVQFKVKEWCSMNSKLLKTIEEAKPWLITKATLSK